MIRSGADSRIFDADRIYHKYYHFIGNHILQASFVDAVISYKAELVEKNALPVP